MYSEEAQQHPADLRVIQESLLKEMEVGVCFRAERSRGCNVVYQSQTWLAALSSQV